MILQLNFGLRWFIKSLICYLIIVCIYFICGRDLIGGWPFWEVLIAICAAYIHDRIIIEKTHTMLTIPAEAHDTMAHWVINKGFREFKTRGNMTNFVLPSPSWFLRNDFIRLRRFPTFNKMKIDNKWVGEILGLFEIKND